MLRLLPLSRREILGLPDKPLPWETKIAGISELEPVSNDIWAYFLKGGYPELNVNPKRDNTLW